VDGLAISWTHIDVVHTKAAAVVIGHIEVVGFEGKAIQVFESFVGRS